jgi:hypothetical protein
LRGFCYTLLDLMLVIAVAKAVRSLLLADGWRFRNWMRRQIRRTCIRHFAASLNPVEKKRTFGLPFQMQDRLCRQPVQGGSIGSVREEFYERFTPKTLERRGRSGFNGICIAVGSTSLGGHRNAQHSSHRYWRCLFECCYEPEHGNVVDSPGSGCASRWFLQSRQIEGRIHRGA